MKDIATCRLDVNTTLPLVCISTLLSFLCGVGIGANDLSANFAMVVGSGSLNMRQAIIYCTAFELLGAAFMGGHVSSTIRSGIVDPALFALNKDVVVLGMTCASFAAAWWLYLSTVFGLPVSITHTVVGSILGFALCASGGFAYVKSSGLLVVVLSWLIAPIAACGVTALLFYMMRRDVLKVKGRSFSLALAVLPYCLLASLLVDFFFVLIERPPIMSYRLAQYVSLPFQYALLLLLIFLFCWVAQVWVFPQVAAAAMGARSFVWESEALRTEPACTAEERSPQKAKNLSIFKAKESRDASPLAAALKQLTPPPPPSAPSASEERASFPLEDAAHPHAACSCSPNTLCDNCTAHRDARTSVMPSDSAAPRAAAAAPPLENASFVLSSISTSDSPFVRHGGNVRLTPVRRRGQSPNPSPRSVSSSASMASLPPPADDFQYLPGCNLASSEYERHEVEHLQRPGGPSYGSTVVVAPLVADGEPYSPVSVHSEDEFGEEDWAMDHPMQPIRFGGVLIKPFNPRAEFLFTGLQVVAGSMSSFVHGAVAGANATAAFMILYDTFTDHELQEPGLSSQWSVLPAMLGIAIGMFGLGASLMKTVGVELVTVTPARGWCIQVGGTLVTMVLTGIGIPVSLSQSQIGAAIGCGVLDARLSGVSWGIVVKVVMGWVVTLIVSALTTCVSMWLLASLLCA